MKKLFLYLFILLTPVVSGQILPGIISSSSSGGGGGGGGSSLLTNLLFFYNYNEASGNIIDQSGNGYTGTAANLTYSQAGKIGNAVSFNGTSSTVVLSTFPQPTTALTISFWIKTTSTNDNSKWIYAWGSGGLIGYYYTGGQFSLRMSDGTNDSEFQLTGDYADNAWHNIMFVWDGTNINGYVDNVSRLSSTWAHTLSFGGAPDMTLMGTNYGAGWLGGVVDDFGIWSKAVTSDERTVLTGGTQTYPWTP